MTLLAVMDPPGHVPIFLGVTRRRTGRGRRRGAAVGVGTALVIVVGFTLLGRRILDDLDVAVPALQGVGGLLLLLVAIQLLTGDEEQVMEAAPERPTSVAVQMTADSVIEFAGQVG